VGRTSVRAAGRNRNADHPHARGENARQVSASVKIPGPSPRTWGERVSRRPHPGLPRTIPTHVGRTRADIIHGQRETDHPHARGENLAESLTKTKNAGPSPRTWGELGSKSPLRLILRTIPTHVGRTVPRRQGGLRDPDHPHARGENPPVTFGESGADGPSPRTWGEQREIRSAGPWLRTIPTHVGRTDRSRAW